MTEQLSFIAQPPPKKKRVSDTSKLLKDLVTLDIALIGAYLNLLSIDPVLGEVLNDHMADLDLVISTVRAHLLVAVAEVNDE